MPKQQHVEMHRKVDLRKRLLEKAMPGAAFIPFCGDGDLAAELYSKRPMLGCDVDQARIDFITARDETKAGTWLLTSADTFWSDHPADAIGWDTAQFAVGDFDAYANPYPCFREYWTIGPPKTRRQVVFFTDGQRQAILRARTLHHPNGETIKYSTTNEAREAYNKYWTDIVRPWLAEYVAPWRIVDEDFYIRGASMLYCGFVLEAPAVANVASIGEPDATSGPADPALLTDEELVGYDPLRRLKFDATKRRQFLQLLVDGQTRTAAAKRVGVTLRTVERAMDEGKVFADAVSWAEMEANDTIEAALFSAARSGNVSAIAMWLYNRAPDRWQDKRSQKVELKVDNSALEVVAEIIARTVTDPDTLARLRAELAGLASAGSDT